jgi:hypothetical protein
MSKRSTIVSRSLTFTGAAIVFVTFVVKDIMRENLKDLKDEVSTAEIFYLDQSTINSTQSQISGLQSSVGLLLVRDVYRSNPSKDETENEEFFMQIEEQLQESRVKSASNQENLYLNEQYFKNLSRLIDKLPHREDQKKQADLLLAANSALTGEAIDIKGNLDSLLKQIQAMRARYKDDDPPHREVSGLTKRAKEFSGKSATFKERSESLAKDATVLTGVVLKDVQNVENESEKRYALYTKWSYVLYIVGWILGLFGRAFFGTEETGESS